MTLKIDKIIFIKNSGYSSFSFPEHFEIPDIVAVIVPDFDKASDILNNSNNSAYLIITDIDSLSSLEGIHFLQSAQSKHNANFIFITKDDVNPDVYKRADIFSPAAYITVTSNSALISTIIASVINKSNNQILSNEKHPVQNVIRNNNPVEETTYKFLFDNSPAPLWEADFSLIYNYLNKLNKSGISNLEEYFSSKPEEIYKCLTLIRILHINKISFSFFNVEKVTDIPPILPSFFNIEAIHILAKVFISLYNKKDNLSAALPISAPNSAIEYILIRFSVTGGCKNNLSSIMISFLNISDIRKAEIALNKSEKQFKQIWDTSIDGMRLVDKQGKIVFVNEAFCRLVNKTKDELEGNVFSIIYKNEENSASDINFIDNMLLKFKDKVISNDIVPSFERELLLWNGKKVWFELSNSILNEEDDNPSVLSIFRDISERKNYEDKLNKIAKELKEINEAKDKFISILSHDLRGPFNGFLGISEVLSTGIDTLSTEEIKESATILHKALTNQFLLLEDLLVWSRIQTNRKKITVENFKIMDELCSVIVLLTPNAENKSVKIISHIDFETKISGDRSMIQLLFRNLIANAIKFSFRNSKIELNAEYAEDHIVFSVSDEGVGIAPEHINKLFRTDTHFSTTGTEDEVGTGLGLLLCKEITEKHNGKIWVKSEPNKGSTFYVLLNKLLTF